MIHHELGYTYAEGTDGPEAVEMRSPVDFLLRGEDEPSGDDAILIAGEAMLGAMVWILEAGPHPSEVAVRLVACTREYAPAIVQGLGAVDTVAVASQDAALRRLHLMRLLVDDAKLRATQAASHDERISAILAKAYRREGHTWDKQRVASDVSQLRLHETSGGAGEHELRRATLRRWCALIWEAGASLGPALKHFYVVARKYTPELMMNLTGEELAVFFDQVRATTSAREKLLLNKRMARAGYRNTTLRGQKSPAACEKYAFAATGNHHRADSVHLLAA